MDFIACWTRTPVFRWTPQAPPIICRFLGHMARAAIELYWQTADFTVLHMVTGTHAARMLLARIDVELAERFLPSVWTATAAAYVSVGAPRASLPAMPERELDWHQILALAVESMDDHVIKMVYTCHLESLQYDNPLYRAVATRIVQRRH